MTEIASVGTATAAPESRARAAAQRLETRFLAEMLKAAGLGEQVGAFSGGAGEDHFASFGREAIARQITASGGIGLAENIFRAIMEAEDDA
jgi:Rod binding domain-containing protein